MRGLAFLFAAFAVSAAQVSNEWIYVIGEEDFGSEVTFQCNTSLPENQPPEGSMPVRWMLNDLTNELKGFNSSKYSITTDGQELTIFDVGKEDFGVYHCMMMTPEDEWYLIKLGLNVRGPYYEDLWDIYRMNTIIGISAFLAFLTIVLGSSLIYHHRYIVEDEDEANSIDPFNLPTTYSDWKEKDGYANGGFGMDNEQKYESTVL